MDESGGVLESLEAGLIKILGVWGISLAGFLEIVPPLISIFTGLVGFMVAVYLFRAQRLRVEILTMERDKARAGNNE